MFTDLSTLPYAVHFFYAKDTFSGWPMGLLEEILYLDALSGFSIHKTINYWCLVINRKGQMQWIPCNIGFQVLRRVKYRVYVSSVAFVVCLCFFIKGIVVNSKSILRYYLVHKFNIQLEMFDIIWHVHTLWNHHHNQNNELILTPKIFPMPFSPGAPFS